MVSINSLGAQGLWLAVDRIMLGGSVQVCYDEGIALEEMCNIDIQFSFCKSLANCLQEPKVAIFYKVIILQFCR